MKIYLDDIKDFNSPVQAAAFYKKKMKKAAAEGSIEEAINLQILPIFEAILSDLTKSLPNSFSSIPIDPGFKPKLKVVIGEINGKFSLVPVGNSHLVVLDRNSLLSMAMLFYYMGTDYKDAPLLG